PFIELVAIFLSPFLLPYKRQRFRKFSSGHGERIGFGVQHLLCRRILIDSAVQFLQRLIGVQNSGTVAVYVARPARGRSRKNLFHGGGIKTIGAPTGAAQQQGRNRCYEWCSETRARGQLIAAVESASGHSLAGSTHGYVIAIRGEVRWLAIGTDRTGSNNFIECRRPEALFFTAVTAGCHQNAAVRGGVSDHVGMRLRQARLDRAVRCTEAHVQDARAQVDRDLHAQVNVGNGSQTYRLGLSRQSRGAQNTHGEQPAVASQSRRNYFTARSYNSGTRHPMSYVVIDRARVDVALRSQQRDALREIASCQLHR